MKSSRTIRLWAVAGVLFALMNVQLSISAPLAEVVVSFPVCPDPLINKDCSGSDLHLLAPLDDATNDLPVSDVPLETFFHYFNMSWPWLIGVASGIAVLQAVWGGVLIMTSFDRDGGKEKVQWALGGMVIIALVGFILRFLNSIFYV